MMGNTASIFAWIKAVAFIVVLTFFTNTHTHTHTQTHTHTHSYTTQSKAGGVTQVLTWQPSKHKVLCSNLITAKRHQIPNWNLKFLKIYWVIEFLFEQLKSRNELVCGLSSSNYLWLSSVC
jgi:hypothetical protein